MTFWLLKTEPGAYSFDDLERDGRTVWDGVRNYQARNYLRTMEINDLCVIYHSVSSKKAVGIARVVRTAYPDPTIEDERWVAVDIVPEHRLPRPISLAEMKAHPILSAMALIRQSRLSVCPMTSAEFEVLTALAQSG
jgi:predicted RNA-binding protein with PUA-like domain